MQAVSYHNVPLPFYVVDESSPAVDAVYSMVMNEQLAALDAATVYARHDLQARALMHAYRAWHERMSHHYPRMRKERAPLAIVLMTLGRLAAIASSWVPQWWRTLDLHEPSLELRTLLLSGELGTRVRAPYACLLHTALLELEDAGEDFLKCATRKPASIALWAAANHPQNCGMLPSLYAWGLRSSFFTPESPPRDDECNDGLSDLSSLSDHELYIDDAEHALSDLVEVVVHVGQVEFDTFACEV